MSRLIIGFTGPIGSGKTTAAKELCSIRGWARVRFADTLKQMLISLGLDPSETDGDKKELPSELLGGKTPRFAMQTLGTEWGRNIIDSDLWVRAWKKHVHGMFHYYNIVADDVRFPNEVAAIHELGGSVIFINRPAIAVSKHTSEQFAFVADDAYDNNDTEEVFRRLIRVNLGGKTE